MIPLTTSNVINYSFTAAAAKSLQSCPTLCDPIDGSPPGSPVPGILNARTLEWVAISFSVCESEVTQSCPTLWDPMDCSPPGSSIHGIFQARVLEWGAIAFSNSFTWNHQIMETEMLQTKLISITTFFLFFSKKSFQISVLLSNYFIWKVFIRMDDGYSRN